MAMKAGLPPSEVDRLSPGRLMMLLNPRTVAATQFNRQARSLQDALAMAAQMRDNPLRVL